MSSIIEMPCDYQEDSTAPCDKGKLLIYGEMGGRPPETINCPHCGGTGTMKIHRIELENRIAELEDDREMLLREINELKQYLK